METKRYSETSVFSSPRAVTYQQTVSLLHRASLQSITMDEVLEVQILVLVREPLGNYV